MLNDNEQIFKPIFGDSWNYLPKSIIKHYSNRQFTNDTTTVEGKLDVMCKWFLKPFFYAFNAIPPYEQKDVFVTVNFKSSKDSKYFHLDRVFYFKNKQPFYFKSKMIQVKDNEVMEVMSGGICWHLYYIWDGKKVILKHKGYSFKFLKFQIPLPITWLIGAGNAQEIPIDDNSFYMSATIHHWLFGKVYEYKGHFKFTKEV